MLVEAYGPAHPDEVWRRFTDPTEWPGWAPQVRAVETRTMPPGNATFMTDEERTLLGRGLESLD